MHALSANNNDCQILEAEGVAYQFFTARAMTQCFKKEIHLYFCVLATLRFVLYKIKTMRRLLIAQTFDHFDASYLLLK